MLEPLGIRRTEPCHPASYRLVRHLDASFRKEVLHIPKAECEPAVDPDGIVHDGRRKVAVSVADLAHTGGVPDRPPPALKIRDKPVRTGVAFDRRVCYDTGDRKGSSG